jgi:alpha-amylase
MEKKPELIQPKPLRPLLIYNQFPRCYQNINQMTEQLAQIADMGFTAVWINPIQQVGQTSFDKTIGSHVETVKGSLYAMKDPQMIDRAFSTNKRNFNNDHDLKALHEYTATAHRLNLIPMFDLVLNHIASDADLILKHPQWFEGGSAFDSDVVNFNYHQKEEVVKDIIQFWKGYIDRYIDLGFQGIRIDAAKHIPTSVQKTLYEYFTQKCQAKYGSDFQPIIFAEIFLSPQDNLQEISRRLSGLGITHTTNNLHWARLTEDYRKEGHWNMPWLPIKEWFNTPLGQLGLLRQIGTRDNKILGGTIGFSGCHDAYSLYDGTWNFLAQSSVEKEFNYAPTINNYKNRVRDRKAELIKSVTPGEFLSHLKERLAAIAFTSDAGWYLLSGDEVGHPGRKWVFDFYSACGNRLSFHNAWGAQFDLRAFIKAVNTAIKMLPPVQDGFKVQHIVLDSWPGLMIVVRQSDAHLPDILAVNCTEKKMFLGEDFIVKLDQAIDRKLIESYQKKQLAQQIIFLGDISLQHITSKKMITLSDLSEIENKPYNESTTPKFSL